MLSLGLGVTSSAIFRRRGPSTLLDGWTADPTTGLISTTLVDARTATLYVPDHNGELHGVPGGQVAFRGARVELDPSQVFATFTTSATTPAAPNTIRVLMTDGGQSAAQIGSDIDIGVDTLYPQCAGAGLDFKLAADDPTKVIRINVNQLGLSGTLDLSANTLLTTIYFNTNNFSGTLDLSANTLLTYAHFSTNNFSGTLDLSANTLLTYANFNTNNFSGTLDLSANTALDFVSVYNNNFSSWEPCVIPTSLASLIVTNNALTVDAVNQILIDCDTATKGGGFTLNMTGGTNAAPTGAGITAKNALIARGATVTTN